MKMIFIPILHIKKLRIKRVNWLAQVTQLVSGWSVIQSQLDLTHSIRCFLQAGLYIDIKENTRHAIVIDGVQKTYVFGKIGSPVNRENSMLESHIWKS